MIINPVTSLYANASNSQNINRSSERVQNAILALVSGSRLNQASDDVASLAQATELQNNISGLRQASVNVAQTSSLGQVADGGLQQIGGILDRLQTLATQANSGALDDATREQLNIEFQSLVEEVDRIASNTRFNSQSLLDGSLSGDNAISLEQTLGEEGSSNSLDIADVSSASLFDGANLDISTQAGAEQALTSLSGARDSLTTARAEVGSFLQTLNYANANLQTAILNQEAAAATLTDADFAQASTDFSLANLQQQAGIAVEAQAKNIKSSLLALIS